MFLQKSVQTHEGVGFNFRSGAEKKAMSAQLLENMGIT